MRNQVKRYIVFGVLCAGLYFGSVKYFSRRKSDRYFQWYKILYQWILIRQDKIQIAEYFSNNNYKRISIYGMGELGKLLLRELRDAGVNIPFVIDQSADSIIIPDIKVVTLAEVKEDVDIIVVTVVDKFDSIKKDIERYVNVPVISLEDILFSL